MAIDAPNLDDAALVMAVQQGDTDAFAPLFDRHYARVRRACARRLGGSGEADEIAQAAFVRAFERIDRCT
ncbi:MAG TPA: sigma factor, partial [Acidimicrobiales bacterium]|nr:sigma factor [Acidimicrobiales bacterium]